MQLHWSGLFSIISIIAFFASTTEAAQSEEDRIKQWYANGNTWPPNWQRESAEYVRFMKSREDDIMSLTGADERWENFMQFTQSRMLPRFTRLGFKIMQTPVAVEEQLSQVLRNSFINHKSMYDEISFAGSYNILPAKIAAPAADVQHDLLELLQETHQSFAGVKLEPTGAYGIRLNREGSSQAMHCEQV